ncbi:MAG: YgiQ family radical SAM protein [Clostridia bacterium]|nr:YgiQ family radical SAM protein [Clostridia bacterium]
MKERGWDYVDFVLVTGDAYVDHHSFGTAIIPRLLEQYGYRVAILPQPDTKSKDDFMRFGKPRLGFLINSGVVDSMVNNYSVFKHRRRADEYSPGGKAGGRPDRALIVYANRAREAFRDVPIIIGGLEASLRRFGHYDYWQDKVRRSVLLDSKADLLIYGMGEKTIIEIAEALESGIEVKDITWIRGTSYRSSVEPDEGIRLGDYPVISENSPSGKAEYAKSFRIQHENMDYIYGKVLYEKYDEKSFVVQNPMQEPLSEIELDDIYRLPYENRWHPMYDSIGGIPAFKEIKFSIVSNRGCFGDCSFCAITYHQGRQVRARSKDAIIEEVENLIKDKEFKGYIHDVGGPSANFRGPSCDKQLKRGVCPNRDCLYPNVCRNAKVDHEEYFDILRTIRKMDKVKKVFIRSGIRYDYLLADKKCDRYMEELCKYHISGTLKVAPEHISDRVLSYMKKPSKEQFIKFDRKYRETNRRLGLKQYLIPYLISSHPGSELDDAIELALFLKEYGFIPDQVQDFYPTPGTLATCMYYTELDPRTMEKVYVAKSMEEKKMQRALIHYNKAENRPMVIKALQKAKREELIPVLLGNRPQSRKN